MSHAIRSPSPSAWPPGPDTAAQREQYVKALLKDGEGIDRESHVSTQGRSQSLNLIPVLFDEGIPAQLQSVSHVLCHVLEALSNNYDLLDSIFAPKWRTDPCTSGTAGTDLAKEQRRRFHDRLWTIARKAWKQRRPCVALHVFELDASVLHPFRPSSLAVKGFSTRIDFHDLIPSSMVVRTFQNVLRSDPAPSIKPMVDYLVNQPFQDEEKYGPGLFRAMAFTGSGPRGSMAGSLRSVRSQQIELLVKLGLYDVHQEYDDFGDRLCLLVVSEGEMQRDPRRYLHLDQYNGATEEYDCSIREQPWSESPRDEGEPWVEYPVGAQFFNCITACVRVTLAEIDAHLSPEAAQSSAPGRLVLDTAFLGRRARRPQLEVDCVLWDRSLGYDVPESYWRCREMVEMSSCAKVSPAGFEVLGDDRVWEKIRSLDADHIESMLRLEKGYKRLWTAASEDPERTQFKTFSTGAASYVKRSDIEIFCTQLRQPSGASEGPSSESAATTTILADVFSHDLAVPLDVRVHHHRFSLLRCSLSNYGFMGDTYIGVQEFVPPRQRSFAVKTHHLPAISQRDCIAAQANSAKEEDLPFAWSALVVGPSFSTREMEI
ncbi:uncharacterized protein PFL1_06227 [Pseudozyma flocculosa PF-1]|uniref:Uncharacterized protein n=2 Tax=Pseudozyma flocculosa TaxID=84751 RepID=A0A5C3F6Z7_9BASI|nr:uncharacterized protein PFL1_06227 [Pseudozyma flocculosa PF-1]EPQ26292.1 hypothetical protein PFL1_06227 [Pseudozyma flocculosa PF-1]SPO40253.1 uncharacterized protein PSFLO_05735 [Pseudozyma flocculosa]